jgi:hypothetical protein
MLTKNRIIFFVYFAQLGFLLGTKPLTYLMIAYLTAEFAAIILVFTYYKMKQDKIYLAHLLNIPGAALFILLFSTAAFYIGVAVGEIPDAREYNDYPFLAFYDQIIPIAFTFVGVLVALYAELQQMQQIKRLDFLEREFIVQTLTTVGVMLVGMFSCVLYEFDYRIPIIAMGLARLGMEAYSTKKHLKLQKIISERMDQAKDRLNVG